MVLPIEPTSSAALLGLTTGIVFSKKSRVFLQTLLYYAKKITLLKWNRPAAPTIEACKALVNTALPFYKEAYIAWGCQDKFIDIWLLWILNSDTNSPKVL
ncbi:hypothetical protein XELAEV_18022480mg [Xenopus laevis]|uniref:Uncharacterized protein n=1 Tax=Xenopus laevis TaxID=8355 RepID=A0A974HN88_XENLA|nr:hypothetical protein XELAEV_18022480mg [Xenopus laevis]